MDLSIDEVFYANLLKDKRLICEIPFGQDYIESLQQALFPMGNQAWNYPTLASIMTVGLGIYYYNQGEFWDVFSFLSTPAAQSSWGRRFEDFIRRHDSLEEFRSFRDEHALRYVALILAHGSIPQNCLSDFFYLITREADKEQSGQEVIDHLKHSPSLFGQVDQPIQRFLRYGGEVAEAFVTRFLALWQCYDRGDMEARCALPDRVVKSFSAWWSEHRPARRNNYMRIPRPELHIEPSGQGVYLFLPCCNTNPNVDPQARWHVLDRDWPVSRTQEVRVSPRDSWTIHLFGNRTNQPYTLQGVTDGFSCLFFDPSSGKVISEPSLRRLPEKVWALFKGHLQSEPLPSFEEEFTQWPGYYLAIFDLSNRKQLSIGNHIFDVRRPFFHCDSDPIVPGVHNQDGTSVFCAVPVIRWDGKANLALVKDGKPQGNIDIKSDELYVLLDKPGDYLVELRGPLGESIHKHFILIPGLAVQPDPRILLMPNQNVNWTFSIKDGIIKSNGCDPPYTRSGSSLEFTIEYNDYKIELFAELPQLQWRLSSRQDAQIAEWCCTPITTWIADLPQIDYPQFECAFLTNNHFSYPIGVDLELFLVGQHLPIKQEGKRQRSGTQNTWYFDLGVVRDAVDADGKSDDFNLLIISSNGTTYYNEKVLSVKSRWDLRDFSATYKEKGDQHIITASWHESGKVVSGRWLVIIPLWRPWENAILQYQLEDKERILHTWHIPISDMYPGRYMVRPVHAPWGCDDWVGATAASDTNVIIDVYKAKWSETFNQCYTDSNVDFYLQALLAHWYRPQLVKQPLPAPSRLTVDDIKLFLEHLKQLRQLGTEERIPRKGNGLHNIFIANPQATTQAYLSYSEEGLMNDNCDILPSPAVMTVNPGQSDRHFVQDIVRYYTCENRFDTARNVRKNNDIRELSDVFVEWHKNLSKELPCLYDIIFLCEKYHICSDQMSRQYEELKLEYQNGKRV